MAHVHDRLGWAGVITVRIEDVYTGEVRTEVVRNKITDAGLDYLAGILVGNEQVTPGLLEVAVGRDGTATADGATALGDEFYREALLTREHTATGEATVVGYLAPGVANDHIREVGYFLPDGRMIARALYDHLKSSNESIQFTRTDTFTRAV